MRIIFYFFSLVLLSGCHSRQHCNYVEDDRVILGIFGGMGPEATADLYREIIKQTPAEKDQDHIATLIYSFPQVPDRMESIRNNSKTILPYLKEGVTRLEDAGASFIVIPCNTVHYFYEEMQSTVSIPIIHMIREASKEVARSHRGVHTIGLLATSGTIESDLYNRELEKLGFEVIVPHDTIETEKVMKAVYGIKMKTPRHENEDLLAEAALHLVDRGAELLLLGCTEIPLAFNPSRVQVPVVNATQVLADRAIQVYDSLNASLKAGILHSF